LKQLYATMLQCRLLAQHARRLRSQGRNLYSACVGREAIVVGCVIDLEPEDTVALAPGNAIAALVKGAELSELAGQLQHAHARLGHNIINSAVDEGVQLKLANQFALANMQKKAAGVTVAFATAAATASPSWQAPLKFAARRSLPLIVVVENQSALDLDFKEPRKGLTRMTVDGNDVVAVYRVAYEGLDRTRQGGGPVLIEGKTYLLQGKPQRRADPLAHMERYLKARGLFATGWKDQLVGQFTREIESAMAGQD
jgi:TPP-dependent pyruvate/acetoin dehydrogenase alpha subunit